MLELVEVCDSVVRDAVQGQRNVGGVHRVSSTARRSERDNIVQSIELCLPKISCSSRLELLRRSSGR